MGTEPRYLPYRQRDVGAEGVRHEHGYRIKLYTISSGGRPFQWDVFEQGLNRAYARLPNPAPVEGRPGLAFAIAHQGPEEDYIVVCWWDRENELPTRVYVHDYDGWRDAREGESFCVWDLQIMWHERQAYVGTLLAGGEEGCTDVYLADLFSPST